MENTPGRSQNATQRSSRTLDVRRRILRSQHPSLSSCHSTPVAYYYFFRVSHFYSLLVSGWAAGSIAATFFSVFYHARPCFLIMSYPEHWESMVLVLRSRTDLFPVYLVRRMPMASSGRNAFCFFSWLVLSGQLDRRRLRMYEPLDRTRYSVRPESEQLGGLNWEQGTSKGQERVGNVSWCGRVFLDTGLWLATRAGIRELGGGTRRCRGVRMRSRTKAAADQ